MQCMMDACVEINRLIKCSPKREKFLGEVTIFYYVWYLNFTHNTCIAKLKEESVAETRSHEEDVDEQANRVVDEIKQFSATKWNLRHVGFARI